MENEWILFNYCHGGNFVIGDDDEMRYTGKEEHLFQIKKQDISFEALFAVVRDELGFKNVDRFYYVLPGFLMQHARKVVTCEKHMKKMLTWMRNEHFLQLYVEKFRDPSIPVGWEPAFPDDTNPNAEGEGEGGINEESDTWEGETVDGPLMEEGYMSLGSDGHDGGDDDAAISVDSSLSRVKVPRRRRTAPRASRRTRMRQADRGVGVVYQVCDDSADEGVAAAENIDVDQMDDNYVDDFEVSQLKNDIRQYKKKFNLPEGSSSEYGMDSSSEGSIETDSEDEDTVHRRAHRYPVYKAGTIPDFQLGLLFSDAKEFRAALIRYGIHNGHTFVYRKNSEKEGVRALCAADGCGWFVYASLEKDVKKFQLKTMHAEHNCQRVAVNRLATSTWIAHNYAINKLRVAPELKPRQLKEMILDDLHIDITSDQARKTKMKAMELLKGNSEQEYARLGSYALELMRVMPGSDVILTTRYDEEGVKRFQKFYVCLEPVARGYKEGCRPVIGLDGCFLKTEFGGQLLSAVSRDGDNHIFPIAWAVVDKETTNNWRWFLMLLKRDIACGDGEGLVILSDQQKGLVNAVDVILGRAEHRLCARHLFANFIKRHHNPELHKAFWEAVKAATVGDLEKVLNQIKAKDMSAYSELISKNPRTWSLAYMSPHSNCLSLDNNMSESFNAWIYWSRYKYIYSMLEDIRLKVMIRMREKRDEVRAWTHDIGPKVREYISKIISTANCCTVNWNGNNQYEVEYRHLRYRVDMDRRRCDCRIWELSGIPCAHAATVIMKKGEHVASFLSHWYSKDQTLRCYGHMLTPMNGHHMWEQHEDREEIVCPPIVVPTKGRPQRKRRREFHESRRAVGNKLNRRGRVIMCKNCKGKGHKKLTCVSTMKLKLLYYFCMSLCKHIVLPLLQPLNAKNGNGVEGGGDRGNNEAEAGPSNPSGGPDGGADGGDEIHITPPIIDMTLD